tara:strand:- start:88 stop:552 length:465 start_codon:yes stop_codon:yes gene_type:complete
MKTGKYFLGGAIKGLGGRAIKVFMKRPEVKKQIADKIQEINNVYAKPDPIKYNKTFKNALKKLDKQEAKAYIIGNEMKKKVKKGYDVLKRTRRVKFGPKVSPVYRKKLVEGLSKSRKIQSIMLTGMRQLRTYRQNLGKKAKAMMQKELSGKAPN